MSCGAHQFLLALLSVQAHVVGSLRISKDLGPSAEPWKDMDGSMDDWNEAACSLVSSRGIMKSCHVFPKHGRSDAKVLLVNDYINRIEGISRTNKISSLWDLPGQNQSQKPIKAVATQTPTGPGAIVYVVTMSLDMFREFVFPNTHHPFILVTGDSDIPPETVLGDKMQEFINDPRIFKWFAQNTLYEHPKMMRIPIGLDYHTLAEKGTSWGSKQSPKEQETTLLEIRSKSKPFKKRSPIVFSDAFSTRYHDKGDQRFNASDRMAIWKSMQEEHQAGHLELYEERLQRDEMWKIMADHQWIVSPRGHGYDCHRHWEVLALGSVPLINAGPELKFYKDHGLPHVDMTLDDWKHLSADKVKANMAKQVSSMKDELPEALKLEYWTSKIKKAAAEIV